MIRRITTFFLLGALGVKSFFVESPFGEYDSDGLFLVTIPIFSWVIIKILRFYNILEGELLQDLIFFSVFVRFFLIIICNSVFLFIFFLEICSFLMIFLILNLSKDSDKVSSAFFITFFNILGSMPFFIFFFLLYPRWSEGSALSEALSDRGLLFFCLRTVLASKLPIFIMHFWLTKAHVRASGVCSIILAGLTLKLGGFGFLKFSFFSHPLFLGFSVEGFIFCCIGILVFSMLIVRFFDLKYFVASSSVVHMGLIMPLYLIGMEGGAISSLLIIVGHGLISSLMFMLVSLIYENSLNRSFDYSKSLESFSKIFSFSFYFFFFMNIGVPPFLNFISELFSFFTLLSISLPLLVVFSRSLLISCLYLIYCLTKFCFSKFRKFYSFDCCHLLSCRLLFFIPCYLFLLVFPCFLSLI